ncbi:MAG: hypothetical protein ACQES4_01865 [Bacillota bacterium]
MEVAHQDLIVRPSDEDYGGICTHCHEDIGETFTTSIHYTIEGIRLGAEAFNDHADTRQEGDPFNSAFDKNCYKCHSSCGSCHVSRPVAYNGGLHSEHMFTERPPMADSCYGCHGARSAGEYCGDIGFTADVHYEAEMDCMDCHDVNNFHGTGEVELSKYDPDLPSCEDCHGNVYEETDIEAHNVHDYDMMNCQVCHSSANNNCFGCHTVPKEDGSVEGVVEESRVMFKIGLNPERTEERPYKYITLRHMPTVPDMYEELGGELPNYDEIPNWKYSPIHNVQRSTIQNESCDACHGNEFIFLSEEDLKDNDSKANLELVVTDIP